VPATLVAGGPGTPTPAFVRKGLMFGAGLGGAVMADDVQGGAAAGAQLALRGGYAFAASGFVLMLDANFGLTSLQGGGSFSITSLTLGAQYFIRDDWAILAGLGGGNVEATRDEITLQRYGGGAVTAGVSHDVWRSPRNNSLALEARITVLDLEFERGTRAGAVPTRDRAFLGTFGGLFQFW